MVKISVPSMSQSLIGNVILYELDNKTFNSIMSQSLIGNVIPQ